MKKLTALLLTLCLLFSVALAEETTEYVAGSYFAITYPTAMTLDDTTYDDETSDGYEWLFILYDQTHVIDACMETVADYAGFSLYSATDDEKQAYIDEALDSFADENCEYVDNFATTANQIPFFIFKMESEDGPYYYIETIANGASISFSVYYFDDGALDDELLTFAVQVLSTFKPAA